MLPCRISDESSGGIFFLGLGGYSLGRFVIDFWRDEYPLFLSLKPGQITSIVIFIFSIVMIIILQKYLAKRAQDWRNYSSFKNY